MKTVKFTTLLVLALLVLAGFQKTDPKIGSIIVEDPLDMEMVYIPAGTFTMGNDAGPDDERPAHEVTLTAFYIGRTVVTQAQWTAVMGYNLSEPKDDDLPAVNLSWEEVHIFLKRLSKASGHVYRLPSEAEWEYASRAGGTTRFHFGDDEARLGDYAWFKDNSGGALHPVGKKKPNAWGLLDTAGNTWEWCEDWWDPGFYARSPEKNPLNTVPYIYTSPQTGEQFPSHVARSGGFNHPPQAHESAHRHGGPPNRARPFIGFRCVREIESGQKR